MARCPACNSEEAYVGILFIECANIQCTHYSKKQLEEVMLQKANQRIVSSGSQVKIKYRYFDDYDSDTMDAKVNDTDSDTDTEASDPYAWIDNFYGQNSD